MTDRMQFSEDDPRHHTAKIKDMMSQAMRHAREGHRKGVGSQGTGPVRDLGRGARWLKADDDFEQRRETAFR